MSASLWLTAQLEREFGQYAGVDEVGLGCWAGPLFACAVIINDYTWPEIDQLGDSKVIGPRKRTFLARRIKEECYYGLGRGEVEEIDTLGLRKAHILAIERAVAQLRESVEVTAVVIDGDAMDIDLGETPIRFIRKGDDLIPAISAASIVAKVTRDAFMTELHEEYPMYHWDKNAAYGSPEHQAALAEYGLSPYHRRSFKPIGRIAHARGDCCGGEKPACCFMHAPKEHHR